MKKTLNKLFAVLFSALLLVSCSQTEQLQSDTDASVDTDSMFYIDTAYYDSVSELNSVTDCVIVAKIISKGDCLSIGHTAEEFEAYDTTVQNDTTAASLLKMSIRTPYTVEVESVLSSECDLAVGDTVTLHQIGGTYHGVTLSAADVIPLDTDGTYVLFLNAFDYENETYYAMSSLVQGYAQLSDNTVEGDVMAASNTSVSLITHPNNHLFDNITSLSDLQQALEQTTVTE